MAGNAFMADDLQRLTDYRYLLTSKYGFMTTIISRKLLSKQTDTYVLVERENQLYVRMGDEYIPKPYFSTKELTTILNKSFFKVHKLCRKLGIQAKANKGQKIRITLDQLRKMAEL